MSWKKEKPHNVDAGKALTAFAEAMRLLGRHALDTEEVPAAKWAETCEAWAKRIEAVGSAENGGGAPEMRSDWHSLIAAIELQTAAQLDHATNGLTGLRHALQGCGKSLAEDIASSQKELVRLSVAGSSLQTALANNDDQAVRTAALALLKLSQDILSERQSREHGRQRLLGERMRVIKADLGERRDVTTLDPQTGLFNREALLRHLERVVDLGPLFAQPPCLMVFEIDLPKGNDELLKQIALCVAGTFLRRQDYVTRSGDSQFAVALVDIELSNVEILCDRLEHSLRELKGAEAAASSIAIAASVWALGETKQQWLDRVTAQLPEARAAGGRRRSVRPPPAQ
jgi:GGDEF domain-containing protein